jgi:hypothetical protein
MSNEEKELLTAAKSGGLFLSQNGAGKFVKANGKEFHGDQYTRAFRTLYQNGLIEFKDGEEYALTEQGRAQT